MLIAVSLFLQSLQYNEFDIIAHCPESWIISGRMVEISGKAGTIRSWHELGSLRHQKWNGIENNSDHTAGPYDSIKDENPAAMFYQENAEQVVWNSARKIFPQRVVFKCRKHELSHIE